MTAFASPGRFRPLCAFVVTGAAALAFAASAHAALIYDNLSLAPDGADPVYSYGPLADSFSTGATGSTFGSAQLLLTNLSSGYAGSLSALLLTNAAGAPGAAVATLGTLDIAAVTTAVYAGYAFTPTSRIALAASTRYWIELVGSTPNAVQWAWSDDMTATGVAGEYSASAALGVNANSSVAGPYQMAITVAAVPEPATFALTGASLAMLVALRGARRRKEG